MKRLKKIKIIESGRSYSPEELRKIVGGSSCYSFTGCNKYDNCGLLGYESCKSSPTTHYGYEDDGGDITCSIGYSFSSCEGRVYTSCGSGKLYIS